MGEIHWVESSRDDLQMPRQGACVDCLTRNEMPSLRTPTIELYSEMKVYKGILLVLYTARISHMTSSFADEPLVRVGGGNQSGLQDEKVFCYDP